MSTKQPTSLPEWSSDQDTYPFVTEPPGAQKESGWQPNQVANSGYQNWYQELVYRWIEHLDGVRIQNDANATSRLSSMYSTGTGEDLNGIAADGAGVVVAVGDTGDIARLNLNAAGVMDTPDGAITDNFNDVAWDDVNSVFILVGDNKVIQSSPGNGTWTSRLDTGDPLNSVAVSAGGVAVAVGENGLIIRSTDGFATLAAQTSPIVGADWKVVVWADLLDTSNFYAIADTGAIGVAAGASEGTGWLTQRAAVGAADVNNLGFHPNWGLVARYNNTLNIRTLSSGGGTDYTISELIDAYGGMLLLDHSIIFYAGGAGGTAFLQIWGGSLENRRVIPYATSVPVNRFAALYDQIWAVNPDNIYSGGVL